MKIFSWNSRGLGKFEKRGKVKRMVRERKIDMVLIQETKKTSMDRRFVQSMWSGNNFEFIEVDAIRRSGGILCIWNSELFSMRECCSFKNCLIISGIYELNF